MMTGSGLAAIFAILLVVLLVAVLAFAAFIMVKFAWVFAALFVGKSVFGLFKKK